MWWNSYERESTLCKHALYCGGFFEAPLMTTPPVCKYPHHGRMKATAANLASSDHSITIRAGMHAHGTCTAHPRPEFIKYFHPRIHAHGYSVISQFTCVSCFKADQTRPYVTYAALLRSIKRSYPTARISSIMTRCMREQLHLVRQWGG